jgi:hypothetical protein
MNVDGIFHKIMREPTLSRQALLTTAAFASVSLLGTRPALAAPSIQAKLDGANSAALLKPSNPGLSPPMELAFPKWLEGEWQASQQFAGYELPAKDVIPRDALFKEVDVPGFKKLSIAFLPDVGKEGVRYQMRWAADAAGVVREDRIFNFRSAIRGGLGYDAIERVDYKTDPNNQFGLGSNTGNPNRLKLVFAPGLTPNAERIELFINEHESEQPEGRDDLFYTSEALRQVTFSAGQTRQVNGEYAHFISYRRVSETQVNAICVTACYADPLQLERFFIQVGPNRPLIVFSHGISLLKSTVAV